MDPNHSWVELGPIYAGGFSKYPFPTRKAAEKFAASAKARNPHREVRVLDN